jgi:hypothetical protein
MQVTVENLNSVKKKLHIEIPNDVVVQELDKAYKNPRFWRDYLKKMCIPMYHPNCFRTH